MRRLLAAVLGCVVAAAPAAAQTAPAAPAATQSAPAIDASALGISLSRISRRLAAESQARREGASPLKLEYFVDVYGTAPQLRFFTGQDLVYGGVPGSAPTHRDMMMHVTPQAFRSPRGDFLSLLSSAAMFGAKKAQDWNYDRQYEAYRKLIEAGQNVPAPKPRQ
jgi:hypothetical protein